jgi:Polyketide cyclase / dehydrase and lipid transport
MSVFVSVAATPAERRGPLAGDQFVTGADVVMDRAFTVPAAPEAVWPWLAQLGKQRAGWYLPRAVERMLPPSRRGARSIEQRWQRLGVGDVIPDYGGRHETFTVAEIDPPRTLVYLSQRGHTMVSWSITLHPGPPAAGGQRTRVRLRLRMAPVRHQRLARTAGELLDLLTIAGMAAGLRERLDG